MSNPPTRRMPRQRRGEPIPAATLTAHAQAIDQLALGVRPPQQITGRGERESPSMQQFLVVSVGGDYLVCHTWSGTAEGATEVIIAKPYLLRRTPFDGESRNGISYVYASDEARTADNGTDTESQVIVPSYVAGDVVYAARGIAGGTGVTLNDTAVPWLDLNVDGRAWAKVSA